MIDLIDTHCHIHSKDYGLDSEQVILDAKKVGVNRGICVGTDLNDSILAVNFAKAHKNIYSSIGIHPHEAKDYVNSPDKLDKFASLIGSEKLIAIGECGLDYFYNHSNSSDQKQILRFQLELAQKNNLPVIFHVRQAFEDFWPIFDEYPGIVGVIHSFTADEKILSQIISRGLYIGLNGIMTFTKDESQLRAARLAPIDKILLETDSPFLTPVPYRGTIAQLKHVINIADFLAKLRSEQLDVFSEATTNNAKKLFNI
jgi:TatD DNase family protein